MRVLTTEAVPYLRRTGLLMSWHTAIVDLTEALLQDPRPDHLKLSVSVGTHLRASGDSLEISSRSGSVQWSEQFLAELPAFIQLRQQLGEALAATSLQFSHAPETHAGAVLAAALSQATSHEESEGATLHRGALLDYLYAVLAAAQAGRVEYTLCRRLIGVEMTCARMQLGEGVCLVQLSDEEVTQRLPSLDHWQYGLVSSDVAPLHRVEIRVARQEQLTHFDSLFQGPARTRVYLRETERVQEALLLLKPEAQIDLGTPFFLATQPSLGRCSSKGLPRSFGAALSPPSLIRAEDAPQLQQAYQIAIRAQSYPALRSALHRYVLAGSRQRPEDRLVDLVIGFESLLLQGLQSELSHRFSLNGSSLSHWIQRAPRMPSYHLFRSAYAARSALVHGYGPKLKSARLESLCDELHMLLASFIPWLVQNKPRLESEDWLKLLFESPPA